MAVLEERRQDALHQEEELQLREQELNDRVSQYQINRDAAREMGALPNTVGGSASGRPGCEYTAVRADSPRGRVVPNGAGRTSHSGRLDP